MGSFTILFLGSFCREKLNIARFCILTLASVANATKICCVQKIKDGRNYLVARESMLNSRASTDYFLLQHLVHLYGWRGGEDISP